MARMAEASLHELLDALDLQGMRILTPDADLDIGVRAVVIADAQQLASVPAGAFVLIPGAPGDRAALGQAIGEAAAAGAVGVSIRETSWASATADQAVPEVAVPVVGIPDRLPWGDLYEMLSTLLAAAGGLAARHPSDRPMADLFAFADAVAGALGGAVTIEDHQARLLAYSSLPEQEIDSAREDTILHRRVPLTDGFRAQYVQLTRTTEALPFSLGDQTDPGTPTRMAIAIRAGDQILGFLWVIGDRTTLAPDIAAQLAHAARMAAVHLMRARAVGDVARQAQDDALIRLLEGPHDKRLLGAVGLRRCRSAVVLAAKPVSDTVDGAEDPGAGWLGGLVAVIARSRHPGAQCVSVDGVAYVVVGSSSERPPDLAELAWTIVDRTAGHSRQLHIGIATTDAIEQLDRARRDADDVLAALAERGDAPAVATLEDVRGLPVLVALKRLVADCPQLLSGPIRAMLAPDRRTPAWCVETLRTYLACFGNQPATAKALGIHPNTLRYRLNRVTELFDLRLDDPDERLVLALQLRLLAPPRSGD